MQTAIIWNEIEKLEYLLVNDDWREFDGIYLNKAAPDGFDSDLWNALQTSLYDKLFENGEKHTITLQELRERVVNGAYLIEAGFLP
jgi:hypothetical protein